MHCGFQLEWLNPPTSTERVAHQQQQLAQLWIKLKVLWKNCYTKQKQFEILTTQASLCACLICYVYTLPNVWLIAPDNE